MNRKAKSLIVRAAVLVMIAGMLPAAPLTAGAQIGPDVLFSDDLAITGGTIALNPPVPLGPGSFTYSTQTKLCTGVSDPTIDTVGEISDLLPYDCNVPSGWTSSGLVDFTACGTGTARANFASQLIGPTEEVLEEAQLWITFSNFHGTVTGTVTEVEQNGSVSYPASIAGTAEIKPLLPLPSPPGCLTGFLMEFYLEVSEAAGQP
jgi:hypothetical protein